jgi:penicillin V acylase-like amidase (Ntn superfamily)
MEWYDLQERPVPFHHVIVNNTGHTIIVRYPDGTFEYLAAGQRTWMTPPPQDKTP